MPKPDQRMFGPQHHNAIAKGIREEYALYDDAEIPSEWLNNELKVNRRFVRSGLARLAVSMAKRFAVDNEDFDPIKWLDQCSPNTDLYPLSELWQED